MRVGSGPQAELNSFFVFLPRVMRKRDVEFLLNLRIVAIVLDPTEERFVAGVVAQRGGNLMAGGQIHAQIAKSSEQFRVIGVEQIGDRYSARVCTPLQQQIKQIQSPIFQDPIERRPTLHIRIVTVTQQEQDKGVISSV